MRAAFWPHDGSGGAWIGRKMHGLHGFSSFCNFDQFSFILYDFCMISTIPNNLTQKHKNSENTQLYPKIIY